MKKTVLYDQHTALNARMVEFGGFMMPVQYTSIVSEHHQVRQKAGLFDLCHMGRLRVIGPEPLNFIDTLTTNRMSDLKSGRARYSLLVNGQGFVLDDILVYAEDDAAFVVANASNKDKVVAWINDHLDNQHRLEDLSDEMGMIAIQGPLSVAILKEICHSNPDELPYYGFGKNKIGDHEVMLARTGYTGEDGFEIFASSAVTPWLWDACLNVGESQGLQACGLGARDTLRLEAGMPLYGHEIDDSIHPFEATLGWAVKLKNRDFVGADRLREIKSQGWSRTLVGLEVDGKRVPRQGYRIHHNGQDIGFVCSGTASPTLGKHIATAMIDKAIATQAEAEHLELQLMIRDRSNPCRVVSKVFYKRPQSASA